MTYVAKDFSASQEAHAPVAAGASPYSSSHFGHYPSPNHLRANNVSNTCEPTPRNFRGGRNGNKSRIGTGDLSDWLADTLRNKSAKDISDDAGCGIRTAENAKQGRNTLSAKHLANMQMNDPIFAAAWAEYVGLLRPGEAEFAGALTQAFNAYARRSP